MKMFVNCSNHPSDDWPDIQREAANKYGEIVDVIFPTVPCNIPGSQLDELANQAYQEIMKYNPDAVMCMGEFVVCYKIVTKLKKAGIKVLASCSDRVAVVHTEKDGSVKKETVFKFMGFREY